MDTFIQKMRLKKTVEKPQSLKKAWKAIASKLMGRLYSVSLQNVKNFGERLSLVTQNSMILLAMQW